METTDLAAESKCFASGSSFGRYKLMDDLIVKVFAGLQDSLTCRECLVCSSDETKACKFTFC